MRSLCAGIVAEVGGGAPHNPRTSAGGRSAESRGLRADEAPLPVRDARVALRAHEDDAARARSATSYQRRRRSYPGGACARERLGT